MVVDGQMPIRVKRIQYFDDRLFRAIHAAQTGELPFPEPGSGGPQGNLPLSVRAMPMTPPPNGRGGSETAAFVEGARQAAGGQPSGQTDVASKKAAPVVQAVIAEEQRQMEMDFASEVPTDDLAKGVGDEQVRSAVDGLGALESAMKDGL